MTRTTSVVQPSGIALALGGALLAVPLLASLGYLVAGAAGALSGSGVQAGTWTRVLADSAVWRSVGFTLWYATAGTGAALVLALTTVVLFAGSSRLDSLVRGVGMLPLPLPPLAGAIAMLLLLGQSGWMARGAAAAHWISAPTQFPALVLDARGIGMIATIAWKEMPFLTLVALALHAARGPSLLDAARTHGATRAQAVRRLVLPMLLRGLAPSLVAVFVFVLGSLELALVLAPSSPMALPVLMQERRQSLEVSQQAAGYAIALLGVAAAAVAAIAHEWLRAREDA